MVNETNANGSPPDRARLEERLEAVERALAESDRSVTGVADDSAVERDELVDRLASLEERLEEVEAATQAVRGYVGAVRAVNREVERRADLALARATAASGGCDATAGRDATTGDDASEDLPAATTLPDDDALEAAVPDGSHMEGDVDEHTKGRGNPLERRRETF